MATLIAAQPKSTATLSSRSTRLIVIALMSLMGIFLFASVRQESQTADEANHLFAGFEYWKHGDFGRNPEHPPLVKLLATIPILPMGLQEPPPVPIPMFKLQDYLGGEQLLYTANADSILIRGRMVVALFSLTLALLVFLAAREMFGPVAGIIALSLTTFEPVLLANGALVTTDMALTCLFFASIYSFYRYVKNPSLGRLAVSAVATGMVIAAKHSGILVFPTLTLLAIGSLLIHRREFSSPAPFGKRDKAPGLLQLAGALVAIIAFSYVFLWAVYCFRYAARPGQLQITPGLEVYASGLASPLKRSIITFFAHHHLLPEAYLFGLVDILLIPGNRFVFIFGHVFPSGRWFFFPGMFLVKSTLTLIIFLLLVPFARIARFRLEFLFLAIPAFFYFFASMLSMVNLGVRHILPIYPFCIVLGAAAASSLASRSRALKTAVAALVIFGAATSLHAFPNYLAYSNEVAGGPSRTYHMVADENVDWGQSLKWTKSYLAQHPSSNCWFDYFYPAVDPAYYGIHCKPLPSGLTHMATALLPPGAISALPISNTPLPSTITGTFLISVNEIGGIMWGPDSLNPYQPFRNRKPDAVIRNTILVYKGTFDIPLLAAQSNAFAASNLLGKHRVPEALVLAQTAAQEAPDAADVRAVLGEALIASGRAEEGQQALTTALHLAKTIHPEFQKPVVGEIQGLLTQPLASR